MISAAYSTPDSSQDISTVIVGVLVRDFGKQLELDPNIQLLSCWTIRPISQSNTFPESRTHIHSKWVANSSSVVTSRCSSCRSEAQREMQGSEEHKLTNEHRNGTISSIKEIVHNLSSAKLDSNTEVVIAPPALYLLLTREHLAPNIEVAAQNVFDKPNGAFTGEISVAQLKDSNITWTILGHSERRTVLNESDDFVATKTKTAIDGGIGVILCCGETLEQREAGSTVEVVTKQLEAVNKVIGKEAWSKVVIAYEPIWAIGTGKVASTGTNNHIRVETID